MITWISTLIRKRGRIIFSVLLAIIIVAFVFTIGAGPGIVTGDNTNYRREFYGVDLNNPAEMQGLQNATMVSRYLSGMRQFDEMQFQQEMLYRQIRSHLAESLAIPYPTEDQLKEFIRTRRAFQGPSGSFDATLFDGFVESLSGGDQFSEAMVSRVLREDYRLQQLDKIMASPGIVSASEVMKTVAREATVWSIVLGRIDYQDFNPQITISDEELASYFQANQLQYEIPVEYHISFLEFDGSLVKEAFEDPGDVELQRFYFANRAQFAEQERSLLPEETDEETTPPTPMELFVQLRPSVFDAWIEQQKVGKAHVIAAEFIGTLFDEEIQQNSFEFRELLRKYSLTPKTLPPFTARPETQLIGVVPAALYRDAMRLDSERYYGDVVPHRDGKKFMVALLEKKLDSRIPALETISQQVRSDLRAERKAALFSEKGIELTKSLRDQVAVGTPFAEAAESLGLKIEQPEPFTLTEQPEGLPFQVLQNIERLMKGSISDMLTIGEAGYFVWVQDREVPSIDANDAKVLSMKQGLANYTAFTRYQAMLQDMVERKLGATL